MATWRDRGRCAVSRERHRQRAVGAETQASARRPKAFSARMTRPGARPRRTCEPSETSGLAPMRPVGRRFCFGRAPTWKQKRRARRCPRVWRLVVRGSGSTGWSALVPPKTPHFDKPVSGTSACSVAGGDLGGRKPLTSREYATRKTQRPDLGRAVDRKLKAARHRGALALVDVRLRAWQEHRASADPLHGPAVDVQCLAEILERREASEFPSCGDDPGR